jgi:CubicO group peptidase (beta-lactamase class C family)
MRIVEPESVGMASERLARIPRVMQGYVDRGEAAGIVTLVARRGGIAHLSAVGCRDVERDEPMTDEAICRIYSMTKPVTTVAALMLYEEGAFHLDDPVAEYLPAFRDTPVFARETAAGIETEPQKHPMTVRHLMTHTAGLVYPNAWGSHVERLAAEADLRRPDEPLADKVARLAAIPLDFQPGSAWKYSLATDVLGHLVEVLTGQELDAFMEERVFAPLGMVDTGFWAPPERAGRLSPVYARGEDGLVRLEEPELGGTARPPYLSGGGGLVSTAWDYARFAQMLLNGGELERVRLLGRKTVALMTANHLPAVLGGGAGSAIRFIPETWPFNRGVGMGLGVRVTMDVAETGFPGSVGTFTWQGAASTDFWVDPVEEMVGVILLQRLPGWYRLAEDFRVLAYGAVG